MTDQEVLRQQLQAMIEKAKRALRAAKEHLVQGDMISLPRRLITLFFT